MEYLMNKALLTIAYILLVIPAGLVLRVLRDPMRRSRSRSRRGYWQNPVPVTRRPVPRDLV
jgi:hypothetical protein